METPRSCEREAPTTFFADGAPPNPHSERNEPQWWGKAGSGRCHLEKEAEGFMNGPSGQENSPGPSLAGPSLLPQEIPSAPSAGKEATHPGGKPTTHSPASAPTRNIPGVVPSKLTAFPPGSLHDNRCPPASEATTHSSWVPLFLQSASWVFKTLKNRGVLLMGG